MKITKLLAMLLALAMILCCFAACGSSDKDDEKDEDEKVEEKDKDDEKDEDEDDKSKDDEDEDEDEDEDKDEDKDEDTEEIEVSKDADLEGKWVGDIDLALFLLDADAEDFDDVPELMFGIEFEFDGGEYSSKAVDIPDADEFIDLMLAVDPDFDKEEAEMYAEDLISEIESDPTMIYGEYEVDGDVIILDGYAEVKFNIDGNEMTFEEIDSDVSEYSIFEGVTFEKK